MGDGARLPKQSLDSTASVGLKMDPPPTAVPLGPIHAPSTLRSSEGVKEGSPTHLETPIDLALPSFWIFSSSSHAPLISPLVTRG